MIDMVAISPKSVICVFFHALSMHGVRAKLQAADEPRRRLLQGMLGLFILGHRFLQGIAGRSGFGDV